MRIAWGTIGLLVFLSLVACQKEAAPKQLTPERSLTFERNGKKVAAHAVEELSKLTAPRVVTTFDPYYEREKRFRALSVSQLLSKVFGESQEALRTRSFVLTALDGYAVPVAGSLLIQDDAYLAIDDVDVPGFAPIGPRKASPAPSYLIWEGADHKDVESHPRPWQLSMIAIVEPKTLYPHTLPKDAAKDSAELLGYSLFQERCIRCHAINREGGRVGPDLNVPQSIVQYRPEPQIRAYIKNPITFRYGVMPPNPDLSEAQLDQLIAYFRAMAAQPHDPEAKAK